MCDYSLEHVASRPAAVADRLVSAGFKNSFTRGFIAADDPNTAVCLVPGTEIAFDEVPRYESGFFLRGKPCSGKVARFRQIDKQVPHRHHDALEFADGTIVMLTHLMPGQRATVLQLPADGAKLAPEKRTAADQDLISA